MSDSIPNDLQPKSMTQDNHGKPAATVTLKIWQMAVMLLVVAFVAVACTITVNMVMQDNARHEAATASVDEVASSKVKGQDKKEEKKSETAEPEKSVRGNLVKRISDKAALLSSKNGSEIATWTLTAITPDIQCDAPYAQPAQNGHFLAFDFDVTTASNFTEVNGIPLTLGAGGQWKYYLADGTLWNGDPISFNSSTCLNDTETLPSNIGNATNASGKVLFDLPTTDGILVFSDDGGITGWEYNLQEHPSA